MSKVGILSYGAYVPRKRMSRAAIFDAVGWAQPSLRSLAKGARAFGAWDEDPVTMAVAAARVAQRRLPAPPGALCFASTTAPFLDRQNAGIVAAALDLPSRTHVFDAAGSQRAATSALIRAAQNHSGANATLLTAAECRPAKPASAIEFQSGDAAAAVVIGEGEPLAEIVGVNAIYADLVDHYRTAESATDYVLEERWFREQGLARLAPEAVAPLLERTGVSADQVSHLIAPLPNPALAQSVAKALGIDSKAVADSLFDSCGHAGAAHPLFMLAHVLETAKPGAWILLVAFGQGCDAILMRTTDGIGHYSARGHVGDQLNAGAIETNYMRFLSARGAIEMDWGMRAERDNRTAQTVAFNKTRDLYGLVGGRCAACGTPQFPKARRCVNPACGALDRQDDYRFADRRAVVKSFTEDWLAFTREPPLIYGNVSFEGGGNLFMEMTGFEPGDAAVGAPLEMQFRIKDCDAARGFRRYFWKAAPAAGGGDG